ncbi:Uncharacterized protein OBRU01_17376 [Operophtera brumata]|uniref:Carboxylesterase type B domain-containing protein n=1 Tax=Operophtera brumata TaxID=104452 RepID=A0A0L7L0K6_OPEBR|nr:Uncharacterized protein OBRU01_17376 [Operophtera brumata]
MEGKSLLFSILFVNVLIKYAESASRINPLVETKLGLIRGIRATDGEYSMYMGIPYAYINESNPFGPASPNQGFDTVFDAYDDSVMCPQIEEFNNTIAGSIDCLHINVYVPNTANSQNRLPVLVWIFGGGFSIGFPGRYVYGPKYLVRHDIILVTLNYRLGPYGFMCLDNPEVPGNQGLKDQRLALKWVKDNIEAFGGDANKVTLYGESAGAAAVDLHLYNPEENLFEQMIMQSGSALSPWAVLEPDTSAALALAGNLGFETINENEALSYLSKLEPGQLIAATRDLNLVFRPCVENIYSGVENFIIEHPVNAALPSVYNISILTGYNNRESLIELVYNKEGSLLSDNVFRNFLIEFFDLETEEINEMERVLRNFYIGDERVTKDTISTLIDFNSDYTFNKPTDRSIPKYMEYGCENIYHYIFSYDGERNFMKDRLQLNEEGAAHADEISYQFDVSYMTDEPTPQDQTVIDRVTTLWSNFVKYGNPTPATSELLPVTWTPVSQDVLYYLDIDSEISVKQRPFHARNAFWDLFYQLNEEAQKVTMEGKHILFYVLVLFVLNINAESSRRIDPFVETKLGIIRGVRAADGEYSMFMGIPYAYVNESNPFGPATPNQGFNNVFKAYDDSAMCPQFEEINNTLAGSLDCLHINVYVPNTASILNRRPVLVWIFGGGFNMGSAGRQIYAPKYLVRHDVVMVTLNYRLGPYGFMCLNNPDVPGNQGLKDQQLALKWVKDNIEAFGGDANKITLFGESAGAAAVDLHLYNAEENLFEQMIMQSGSALSPWAVLEPDTSAPLVLAKYLGLETSNENEALSYLSKLEPGQLITATRDLNLVFRPCVEKYFNNVNFFINEHPVNAALPSVYNISILTGYNSRESVMELLMNKEGSLLSDNVFRNFLNEFFDMETEQINKMEKVLRNFYIGDERVSKGTISPLIDFNSDYTFNKPTDRSIPKYMKYGCENIYHYIFSYEGERNFVKRRMQTIEEGASHADEIGYQFDVSYMNDEPTPEDQTVIDPTSELLPVTWTPVSQDVLYYLDIDSEISVKQRPFHARNAFWELFYKLNKKAQNGYQNAKTKGN